MTLRHSGSFHSTVLFVSLCSVGTAIHQNYWYHVIDLALCQTHKLQYQSSVFANASSSKLWCMFPVAFMDCICKLIFWVEPTCCWILTHNHSNDLKLMLTRTGVLQNKFRTKQRKPSVEKNCNFILLSTLQKYMWAQSKEIWCCVVGKGRSNIIYTQT